MSQALTLARPYARAAYAHARDGGDAAQWSQALGFAARVAADPQVASLLSHPQLSSANAATLLVADGAGESFQRFIELLADNQRLALLPEIAGLYEDLRAEAERVVRATVTSAAELQPGELESIKAALRRRFDRDVQIQTAVDPSLIGGAVIDTGDLVIDGSLRGKLARLESSLTH